MVHTKKEDILVMKSKKTPISSLILDFIRYFAYPNVTRQVKWYQGKYKLIIFLKNKPYEYEEVFGIRLGIVHGRSVHFM